MLRYKGFTLLESLIAILVAGVALVSVALVSVKSLQGAQVSYYRSVATMAAIDLKEKAWVALAMVDGACDDVESSPYMSSAIDYWSGAADENPWFVLPGVNVLFSSPVGDCQFRVDISWDEARVGLDGDRDVFSYSFTLPDVK